MECLLKDGAQSSPVRPRATEASSLLGGRGLGKVADVNRNGAESVRKEIGALGSAVLSHSLRCFLPTMRIAN
jgi:hypothetical protein